MLLLIIDKIRRAGLDVPAAVAGTCIAKLLAGWIGTKTAPELAALVAKTILACIKDCELS